MSEQHGISVSEVNLCFLRQLYTGRAFSDFMHPFDEFCFMKATQRTYIFIISRLRINLLLTGIIKTKKIKTKKKIVFHTKTLAKLCRTLQISRTVITYQLVGTAVAERFVAVVVRLLNSKPNTLKCEQYFAQRCLIGNIIINTSYLYFHEKFNLHVSFQIFSNLNQDFKMVFKCEDIHLCAIYYL